MPPKGFEGEWRLTVVCVRECACMCPWGSKLMDLLEQDLQAPATVPSFSHGSRDSHTGPHACAAGTLLTEPSLHSEESQTRVNDGQMGGQMVDNR